MTWVFVTALLTGLAWGALVSAPLRWILIGMVALLGVLSVFHRRRLKRIKEERKEESIGTFSRALPAKAHDTWVVRAVYEEISSQAGAPIRPSDKVEKFWGIADEDLDDAMLSAARRAGRSMDDVQKNPWRGRVVTVSDMISFIEHQPKEANRGAGGN